MRVLVRGQFPTPNARHPTFRVVSSRARRSSRTTASYRHKESAISRRGIERTEREARGVCRLSPSLRVSLCSRPMADAKFIELCENVHSTLENSWHLVIKRKFEATGARHLFLLAVDKTRIRNALWTPRDDATGTPSTCRRRRKSHRKTFTDVSHRHPGGGDEVRALLSRQKTQPQSSSTKYPNVCKRFRPLHDFIIGHFNVRLVLVAGHYIIKRRPAPMVRLPAAAVLNREQQAEIEL